MPSARAYRWRRGAATPGAPGSVRRVLPDQAPPPTGSRTHRTTTVERGSFAVARCTCGWSGPARRARDRARQDAADHLADP